MTAQMETTKPGSLGKPQSEFDKFVYTVSHDLQEPLRGVSAFLKLLDQKYSDQLDDQARQYIGFTLENADKMRQMILSLVEYSRVARCTEEVSPIYLKELSDAVWTMFEADAKRLKASFEVEQMPEIKGVTSQVVQLIQILLQNSLDNPAKEPLQIRLRLSEEDAEYKFAFSDNGSGIPDVHLESVFDIFHKVDPKSERPGAGLAIARAIVEKHGGKIYAESRVGDGTTVYFTWPKPG